MNECCKKYKLKNFCAECGSKIEADPNECPTCQGSGTIQQGIGYGKYEEYCSDCFGSGQKQRCTSCKGKVVYLKPGFCVCQSCITVQPLPKAKNG